jgi:Tfp pilus assembly protein PilN
MAAPNELSFLPDDYLARKASRRANALCAGLSVIVMGGIASTFWITERSMRDVENRAVNVDKQFTDAARSIDQVNQMKAQQRKIVRQAELAASLVEKVPRSNLLAEFTNALPSGMSLLDFSLDSRVKVNPSMATPMGKRAAAAAAAAGQAAPGGPPQPEPVKYDVYLKLTGIADTDVQVAQFMSKLAESKLVSDVRLMISDTFKQKDREMRRFQIEMLQNPAAEVKDDPKPKTSTAAVELKQ